MHCDLFLITDVPVFLILVFGVQNNRHLDVINTAFMIVNASIVDSRI